MNEAVMREKLLEISDALMATDKASSEKNTRDFVVFEKAQTIEEVLEQLRLQVKYTMFDRDACQRENRYLRQMLDTRPPQPRKDVNDDADPNAGWR